jgi:hypothetical protein
MVSQNAGTRKSSTYRSDFPLTIQLLGSPHGSPSRCTEPVLLKGVEEHVAGQALCSAREGQRLPPFYAARLWGTHWP